MGITCESQAGYARPGADHRDRKLVREMDEAVYQQISDVATLPGITRYALCMADGHSGYGFPIGGVAAMDVHEGGVISPGGIGFDTNCGMRLVTTNLTVDDVQPHLKEIVDRLFERVPAGVGTHSVKKACGAATKGKRASGSEHTRDASGRHSLAPGLRSLWIRVDRLPKAGTSLSLSWSRSGCPLRTPYT